MLAPKRIPTILFLIADTGAGHRSAANAIRNALLLLSRQDTPQPADRPAASSADQEPSPAYRIEIIDAFAECSRFPLRNWINLYGPAIKYNPTLYGRVYHLTNHSLSFAAAEHFARPFIRRGLIRLLREVQPDIIVSIHPLLNHATLCAMRALGVHVPFITVVTDLVSIHYSWIAREADCCIVPTEEARQLALARGMPAERIQLLGMPIDPKFCLARVDRAVLRTRLQLDPALPVVLLVGGGEGAGGLYTAVRAIMRAAISVQLLVVTGHNRRLYARLEQLQQKYPPSMPIKLFGFVRNMPDLMHAADVIVTKAGPGTISEAMACGLPIILTGAVPGQEEGNITYVTENGLGVLAETPAQLVTALQRLLQPDAPELQQMRTNIARLSRPQASFDIARLILSYLPDQALAGQEFARVQKNGSYMPLRRVRVSVKARIYRLRQQLPQAVNAPLRQAHFPSLVAARSLMLRGHRFGGVHLRRTNHQHEAQR
jgi:1,2-diacylglycerol 3-beta-galactosyltransferase